LSEIIETFLGIGFSSNKIHFTELEKQKESLILKNAESVEVDFDFEDDLSKYKSNNKALTNISGELLKYISKRSVEYSKISLTISSSQAFMIILPLEFSEGKQSLNSKIYWELSNYFPDNYTDFIINTYRLNSIMPCGKTDEFLIIAVLKNTLEFVKRIFRICSLNLSIIDIDHFAAENILRENYISALTGNNSILLGLKKGRFDFGFISNKKYTYFTYSKYYSEPEYNLTLIRKLNSLLKSRFSKTKFDCIYLYGDEIRDDTLEALKKNNGIKINVINPFEKIGSSTELLKNDELRKISYTYTPVCGVAQRSITGKN